MNEKSGKLVMLRREGKILSLLLERDRLVRAAAQEEAFPALGDVVIGKVKNVAENIRAAFVDVGGALCFLPLEGVVNPVMTNRVYDGRILAGDELAVQIDREAVKTKDAVVTTKLSFSGKYAVITVGENGIRYSCKLSSAQKQSWKQYLRERQAEALLHGFGAVIRTNAGTLSDRELLLGELDVLAERAADVLQKAASRTCFSVLYKAPERYLTGIRDSCDEAFSKIITDDAQIYRRAEEYLRTQQPQDLSKLVFYEDSRLSLSSLYGIESKLSQALGSQVWLPSGGYLVIEVTEALIVIDVNTGKYSGRKNTEETFRLINEEACREIAVQIPLRNLSGMILIDFINMKEKEHNEELLRLLSELLAQDSVKTTVVDMTPLGLVEVTRRKQHKTLAEQLRS